MNIASSIGSIYCPTYDDSIDLIGNETPFSALLPGIDGKPVKEWTVRCPDAEESWLHPDLRRAASAAYPNGGPSSDDWLQNHLARVITTADKTADAEERLVEPGVGRTFIVDRIEIGTRPALRDFICSGVGLTTYARSGYVSVGRHLDGKISLVRALHRKVVAERLEEIECRSGSVAAIYKIGGSMVRMLDGSGSPAVIMVRGFRSGCRVKQLDPIASFLHCAETAAVVSACVLEPIAQEARSFLEVSEMLSRYGRFGPAADDVAELLGLTSSWEETKRPCPVRDFRIDLVARYARLLLTWAAGRQGFPIGDRKTHATAIRDHAIWFCRELGRQLRQFKLHGFLHDYHHPGVSRYSPNWLHTLVENNVTLAAEFADLETALFVGMDDAYLEQALQLTSADLRLLRSNFNSCHEKDVLHACRIADTIAAISTIASAAGEGFALSCRKAFTQAYSPARHSLKPSKSTTEPALEVAHVSP